MFRGLKIWTKIAAGFAILVFLMVIVTLIAYYQNRTVAHAVDGAESLMGNQGAQDMMQRIIELLQAREGAYGLQGTSGELKDVADQVKSVTSMVDGLLQGYSMNASQRDRLQKIAGLAGSFRSDYMAYWVERGNESRYAADWKEASQTIEELLPQGANAQLRGDYASMHVAALMFLKDKQPILWDSYQGAFDAFEANVNKLAGTGRGSELGQKLLIALQGYSTAMTSYKAYFDTEAQAASTMTKTAAMILSLSRGLEQEFLEMQQGSSIAAVRLMFITLVIAILAGVGIAIFITRGITIPVAKAVDFARTIAHGDLTKRLGIRQSDEVGVLADTLDGMANKLNEMVLTIQENAQQVAANSEEISASSVHLAEGAQNQASTLEETSAAVQEMTASIDQVSSNAQSQATALDQGSSSMAEVQKSIEGISASLRQIADLARQSLDRSQEGARAVEQVVEAITLISQSSDKIGGIVSVISDIANQTNLLALNASIEAARAGESGRGFAVVADEVSKLSDRSAASAREIKSLIQESLANVHQGVERAQGSRQSMEQIRDAARTTSEMTTALSAAMQQQVSAVRELTMALQKISEMSQSISAATEQQSANAKEVSKATETVNELTQQAASSTEQISAAAGELSGMAQQLEGLTSSFKVSRLGNDARPSLPPEETAAPAALLENQKDGKGKDAALAGAQE